MEMQFIIENVGVENIGIVNKLLARQAKWYSNNSILFLTRRHCELESCIGTRKRIDVFIMIYDTSMYSMVFKWICKFACEMICL